MNTKNKLYLIFIFSLFFFFPILVEGYYCEDANSHCEATLGVCPMIGDCTTVCVNGNTCYYAIGPFGPYPLEHADCKLNLSELNCMCGFLHKDDTKEDCGSNISGTTCYYGRTNECVAETGWKCSTGSTCSICDGKKTRNCTNSGCEGSFCEKGTCGANCATDSDCAGSTPNCRQSDCTCVADPQTCEDSDGGENYTTVGTCDDGSSHTDSCNTGTDVLTEYYCSGSSCTDTTKDCDDYDCTTFNDYYARCSYSGNTLTQKGDNYKCRSASNGKCVHISNEVLTCDTWTCNSSKECKNQDCLGSRYACYYFEGNYKWGIRWPSTETACTDGHDNDCDGTCDATGCNGLPPDPDCIDCSGYGNPTDCNGAPGDVCAWCPNNKTNPADPNGTCYEAVRVVCDEHSDCSATCDGSKDIISRSCSSNCSQCNYDSECVFGQCGATGPKACDKNNPCTTAGEVCDLSVTCQCVPCDKTACEVTACSVVPSTLEPGQEFDISFDFTPGISPATNNRKIESPWGEIYSNTSAVTPCVDYTESTTATAPTAPGTYEYEAWCDYSFTTCSITVADNTAPSLNMQCESCFYPTAENPEQTISWYQTDSGGDVARWDICYIEGTDYDDCMKKIGCEGFSKYEDCVEVKGNSVKCCEPNCAEDSWEIWYENMDPSFTEEEFDLGSATHLYFFQVKATDRSGNEGWSQVPMLKIVDHEFAAPAQDFYYASPVPSTLDLATDQTIYLDVPQGGTITAAPIKLTGGSDAPKDLTIKIGGTSGQSYADGTDVYKYNGKFAYEYKGTYTPPIELTDTPVEIDFTRSLQEILGNNCSCSGCVDDGTYCTIAIKVGAQTAGKVILDSLNINSGSITTFSDGSSSKTIEFTEVGTDITTAKIKILKSTTINSAKINMRGETKILTFNPVSMEGDGSAETRAYYVLGIDSQSICRCTSCGIDSCDCVYSHRGRDLKYVFKPNKNYPNLKKITFKSLYIYVNPSDTTADAIVDIYLCKANSSNAQTASCMGDNIKIKSGVALPKSGGDFSIDNLSGDYVLIKNDNYLLTFHIINGQTGKSESSDLLMITMSPRVDNSADTIKMASYLNSYGCGSDTITPTGPVDRTPADVCCSEGSQYNGGWDYVGGSCYGYYLCCEGDDCSYLMSTNAFPYDQRSKTEQYYLDIDFESYPTYPQGVSLDIGNDGRGEYLGTDLQVNGVLTNPKITFVGEGLNIGVQSYGQYISCSPVSYCDRENSIEDPKAAFERGGQCIFFHDGTITGYLTTEHSSHQGYVKNANLYIYPHVWCYRVWSGGTYWCPPEGRYDVPNFVISVEGIPFFDSGHKYSSINDSGGSRDGSLEESYTPSLNPSYFNTGDYKGLTTIEASNTVYEKSRKETNIKGVSFQHSLRTDYTLAVPSRNSEVTVNGETKTAGELKDGATATYDLTSLTQGVNHLDFSTVGPGTVLTPPYEITGSVGSGKFNYKITGDLSQTIDLASEINKYVHENCPDSDCVVPITFSGTGSTISLSGLSASILQGTDGKTPVCSPFNSPPTAEIIGWDLGCIWPLVTLEFTYEDDDGDDMAVAPDSSYQIEIYDNDSYTGTPLISKIVSAETSISSGSIIYHPVADFLPVKPLYYWRVKVWDSKGADSVWFEGSPTGYEIPAM